MELARRSWQSVAEDPPDVGLIPVGSVEQHGPHAPLGTDLLIAEAIAYGGAESADCETVVCPSVPIGISAEHRHFAGSLWTTPDTFRSYISEIVMSLVKHDVESIVLVNGHGGNIDALEEVAMTLTRQGDCQVVSFTWFNSLTDPPHPMGHGGPLETAALLAIDPALVREERIEEAAAAASSRWGEWIAGTNIAVDVDTFTENGVVGDPSVATKQLGEALLEEAVQNLTVVAETLETSGTQSP